MTILDAMKERRSVRTFENKPLTAQEVEQLHKAIDDAHSPFGGNVTIRLQQFDLAKGFKPNTYGFISGANDFFTLGLKHEAQSALTTGFRFEQVVLRAWMMGLGTCWVAGTFKGSDFDNGEAWPDGEKLTVVCPVGHALKPNLKEKMVRMTLRAANRQPFDKLFFTDDFKKPADPDGPFGEALEMMRLAPSAKNSQPWRALVAGNTVHFYFKPKSEASVIDSGIGICHFWETEKYYGRTGQFDAVENAPTPLEDWQYLVSYTQE